MCTVLHTQFIFWRTYQPQELSIDQTTVVTNLLNIYKDFKMYTSGQMYKPDYAVTMDQRCGGAVRVDVCYSNRYHCDYVRW